MGVTVCRLLLISLTSRQPPQKDPHRARIPPLPLPNSRRRSRIPRDSLVKTKSNGQRRRRRRRRRRRGRRRGRRGRGGGSVEEVTTEPYRNGAIIGCILSGFNGSWLHSTPSCGKKSLKNPARIVKNFL